MHKFHISRYKKYIFIIFLTFILLVITFSKSFSQENIFVVDNIKVKGIIDSNFSRDKYINKAFLNSFELLKSRILLSKDLDKINNVKLKEIRELIKSFQILNETYKNEEYNAIFKVNYNDSKTKEFLWRKNVSFSQPEKISAIFYPVLFINNNMKNFNENFFYKEWNNIKTQNEFINFILPVEDLDDISKIKAMKNKIDKLDADEFLYKYDIKNYVFALMDFQNDELSIYLNTNFNNNKISKNISYKVSNINDELNLEPILKDLKILITDIWKEENIINLSMPLTLIIKFQHKDLKKLDELKKSLNKISIINDFSLQEFDIINSFLKIKYYGNPKKLKNELLKLGYKLDNDGGNWRIY